jgi:hypothetical protein
MIGGGRFGVVTAIAVLVSCSDTPMAGGDSGTDASSSSTASAAAETSVTPPATSATTDAGGSGTTAPPADSSGGDGSSSGGPSSDGESGVVRFIALGDSGEGNDAQQFVANAAEVVCEADGCDFALLLGDNFYDTGVTAVDDPQFITKFEQIYSQLGIPFYVVLGNHDYGTLSNDWPRGQYQVDYSNVNPNWILPDFWYSFSSPSGDTQFFAMDTQRMMWDHQTDEQWAWYDEQMAASTASWKVVVAHHPYISNGQHGNAGNFEGLPLLDFVSGAVVKDFVDTRVCGQADVYFSGHDHNRQAFDPVCGTYFIVSGAAAKVSDFVYRDDNPTQWGNDQAEGFVWVEITGQDFTARFYDFTGALDYEQSFTR